MFNKSNLLKLLFLIFTINNINLCFASDINTEKQIINIINNSDSTMIVSHDIPSETEATINIELKKIDLANDLLKSGILNDSEEQIINAIKMGIDINKVKVFGKMPLVVAGLLNKPKAFKLLLENAIYDSKSNQYNSQEISGYLYSNYKCQCELYLNSYLKTHGKDWCQSAIFNNLIINAINDGDLESAIYILNRTKNLYIIHKHIHNKNLFGNDDSRLPFCGGGSRSKERNCNGNGNEEDLISKVINSRFQRPISLAWSRKSEQYSSKQIIEFLKIAIEIGYNPNAIWMNKHCFTKLFTSPDILEFFLKNGSDPNHRMLLYDYTSSNSNPKQPYYTYPIFLAISYGNKESVKLLLSHGAFKDQIGTCPEAFPRYSGLQEAYPLMAALRWQKQDIVQLLTELNCKLQD